MSSDGYFDDELDSAFLNELDAVEAAHFPLQSTSSSSTNSKPTANTKPKSAAESAPREAIEIDDSDDYDCDFPEVDEEDLRAIDEICSKEFAKPGSSRNAPLARTTSKNSVQMNLFGEVATQIPSSKAGPSTTKRVPQRTLSLTTKDRPKRTKQWDYAAFAKTGWRKPKESTKGKERAYSDEEEEEPDQVEFEQFPAPQLAGPPPAMKQKPDLFAAKTWIYPLNRPKRDYQFNIVKHSLFQNTLVALPTGLGKTFIAGVVMLNYYNWFPTGKIIFVAPTKPLVRQQIEACHEVCGIPGTDAEVLIGGVSKAARSIYWQEKRVFYMTPQTLMIDLISGACDPEDIVLLVVDEAHKGTGDYAYATVVRFLMAKNPHFRLLALTATPGSNAEAVQKVVDCLHISNVEIRNEDSLDIRPYIHDKRVEQHIISMSENINRIKHLLAAVMTPIMKPLLNVSLIHNSNAAMLHPYACTQAIISMRGRRDKPEWAIGPLVQLGTLARAMSYLLEESVAMCQDTLKGLVEGTAEPGKKAPSKATQNKFLKDPNFKSVMHELENWKNREGGTFGNHPKLEKLTSILVDHFTQHDCKVKEQEEAAKEGRGSLADKVDKETRVMVFASFRGCVEEIVEALNVHSPLIRAVPFIGQGTDSKGRKGYQQKQQMSVIQQFKQGDFNVLVSTSIGEEGLDIGEVDMIICYESQKTPIRMLQRIGRTGRKRDGVIHVLLAEGREERNWDTAKDNYKMVQDFMVTTSQLELYDDVDRMLPKDVHPECVEMLMDIQPYIPEERTRTRKTNSKGSPSKAGKKKEKGIQDYLRNIPAGAATGFVSARELTQKGTSKKRQKELKFEPLGSDDDDREIEAGIFGPRRTVSMTDEASHATKKKPRRATTIATTRATETKNKKRTNSSSNTKSIRSKTAESSSTQFDELHESDTDDLEIERGIFGSSRITEKARKNKEIKTSSPPVQQASLTRSSSPDVPLADQSLIDLTTPDPSHRNSRSASVLPPSSPPPQASSRSRSISPIIEKNVDELFSVPDSSPVVATSAQAQPEAESMAWLVDDDDDPDIEFIGSSPARAKHSIDEEDDDDEVEMIDWPPTPSKRPKEPSPLHTLCTPSASKEQRSPPSTSSSIQFVSPVVPMKKQLNDMPPPALPVRFAKHPLAHSHAQSSDDDISMPEPTFAVRAIGKQAKKRVIEEIDSSPISMPPPPPQRRLQRERPPSSPPPPQPSPTRPPRKKKRIFKNIVEAQQHNPWLDVEATHSGDERSAGGSSDNELGNESDQEFVEELPETQMPASYDQSAVYRQSLLSQYPARGGRIPTFANGPVRRGRLGYAFAGPSRRRDPVSSSPTRIDAGSDDYQFGSFVVADDAELSFYDNPSISDL
ncbi:hypothetical protein C8Q75DRAFT_298846 [Abortiporus biennis]|nr:hypothetical protein C8Q75DRAFT_298846 [Abortiporus biennis]